MSFDREATLTNCSSPSCSLNVQPIASLSTKSVAARNIIGRGQERNCSLSSSAINSESVHKKPYFNFILPRVLGSGE